MSVGSNSITFVTGGAGAIGAAVCQILAARGERITVCDVDQRNSQSIVEGLPGVGHLALGFDVADPEQVNRAVAAVQAEAYIDKLINVAGWDRFKPFVETSPEFWQKVIQSRTHPTALEVFHLGRN